MIEVTVQLLYADPVFVAISLSSIFYPINIFLLTGMYCTSFPLVVVINAGFLNNALMKGVDTFNESGRLRAIFSTKISRKLIGEIPTS
jgi:hypothetical protein